MEVALMDPRTAKLAVELQLEDIAAILSGVTINDYERSAFEATKSDYEKKLQVLEGRCVAHDLVKVDHANRTTFTRLVNEEKQAIDDHRLARRLAGLPPPAPRKVANLDREDKDVVNVAGAQRSKDTAKPKKKETTLLFEQDYGGKWNAVEEPSTPPSSSSTASKASSTKGKEKAADTHIYCISCCELQPRFDVLELQCKFKGETNYHAYCRACLINLFESSLSDPTLFPPGCCKKSIPLKSCRNFFSAPFIERFNEKVEEVATPNPTYCSTPNCGKWIRPKFIKADMATCMECMKKTCATCKAPLHEGLCSKDPGVKALMKVAEARKWQTCPNCRTMVELSQGCFHIKCKCTKEFCYLCANLWKTCKCPQFDVEHLLIDGARVAADRPNQERLLQQLNRRPVAACTNHIWHRIYKDKGNDTVCEECRADYLFFIHKCERCDVKRCSRCLYNRR